jgi:hypothetical protein
MKNLIPRILVCLLLASFSNFSIGQLEVLNISGPPPVIDGVIGPNDPWQQDNWQPQLAINGSTDASSEFQLLWDENKLYLAVRIEDDTPNSDNPTSYMNDCVQAYFYMTGATVEGTEVQYDESTSMLRWQRDESLHIMDGSGSTVALFLSDENAAYAEVSDPSGWVLEVALPFDVLDPGNNFDGENFMFEINYSDNTGETRTGMLFWKDNSDDQWRWVETFSPVHLSSEIVTNNVEYFFKENKSICEGEVYSWRGTDYSETGWYYDNFTSVSGGDSIFALQLAVIPPYLNVETKTIFEGDSYTWRNQNLSEEGVYYDSLVSSLGCDSILSLHLIVSNDPRDVALEVLNSPYSKPSIDGFIDDRDTWHPDLWQAQTALNGTTDATSKFQLLWDNDILYLAVQIEDDTPNSDNPTSYMNDCVQAYFHMTSAASVTGTEVEYDENTSMWRWPREETTHAMETSGSFLDDFLSHKDANYMVTTDAAGWVLEVAMPFEVLDPGNNFDGENFMFEINYSDNTGETRTGMLFWQDNSDDQWRWVETFSPVYLSDEEVDINAEYFFKEIYILCEGEQVTWRGSEYDQTGKYAESYSSKNGGDSIYALDLKLIPTPEDFSIIGQNDVVEYEVFSYSVPLDSTLNYTWLISNGNIVNSPSNNVAEIQWGAQGQGQVTVLAENAFGCCSDSMKLFLSIGPNTIEHTRTFSPVIYPNPSRSVITIANLEKSSDFTILDVLGKAVIKGTLEGHTEYIDLSSLRDGMYFLRIAEHGIYKVLKE